MQPKVENDERETGWRLLKRWKEKNWRKGMELRRRKESKKIKKTKQKGKYYLKDEKKRLKVKKRNKRKETEWVWEEMQNK